MAGHVALGRRTRTAQSLVDPLIRALVGIATVVLLAALVGIFRDLGTYRALAWTQWVLLAGLLGASYLILTNLILFDWRGQRVALGPDEVLVFIGLAALPPTAVVLFAVPPMLIYQIATKRSFLRGASNVAVVTLAAATCVLVFTLLAPRVPFLFAASGAIVVYTLTTHLLVSSVFSLKEDTAVHVVFRERFWVPTLLHVTLGIAGGIAILGLWSYHPTAVFSLLPFVWLVREHVSLSSEREREALVHRRLAENTRALVGERSVENVASRILTSCGDLFQAGRASLVLNEEGKERRWSRDFEGGHRARPLAASLRDVDGSMLGALVIQASPARNRDYEESDERLLRMVAEETAAAVANARALRALDAARARLETVLATAHDAVLLVDMDGLVRYANPAGRAMLGLRADAHRAVRDLFDDVAFLKAAIRAEDEALRETHARSPTRRFPVEVSAARLRDDPSLILLVVRDASERKAGEQALLSQRVARPLVRRIVRGLMAETRADPPVLMRLGEQLAAGVESHDINAFTQAYAEMGLGRIEVTEHQLEKHEFVGSELLEQTQGSRTVTCYLALGFLRGAVSREHDGVPAAGAEVECRSRGDARCRFVVTLRPNEK